MYTVPECTDPAGVTSRLAMPRLGTAVPVILALLLTVCVGIEAAWVVHGDVPAAHVASPLKSLPGTGSTAVAPAKSTLSAAPAKSTMSANAPANSTVSAIVPAPAKSTVSAGAPAPAIAPAPTPASTYETDVKDLIVRLEEMEARMRRKAASPAVSAAIPAMPRSRIDEIMDELRLTAPARALKRVPAPAPAPRPFTKTSGGPPTGSKPRVLPYKDALVESLRSNRPLVVWVAEAQCPG